MTTWILVADEARARLLEDAGGPLNELRDFVHGESRAKAGEMAGERLSRTHDRAGAARHAIEPHTSSEAIEARRFAQELAAALDEGRGAGRFERLVLFAPPRFLGLLREVLPTAVARCVAAEVGKDVVAEPASRIAERARDAVR